MSIRHEPSRLWRRRLGALLTVAVFALALWLISKALARYDLDDILGALSATPATTFGMAVLLAVSSVFALGGFDWLAIRHLGRVMHPWRVFLGSFMSHGVSHTAGFAALTGGAIRYRVFSAGGLTAPEVAHVIAFCGVTFFLGAANMLAITLIAEPGMLAQASGLSAGLVRGIGIAVAAAVLVYLVGTATVRRSLSLFGHPVQMPPLRVGLAQLAVVAIEISLAAAALFILIPDPGLPFWAFVGVYVVGNIAGFLTHVPGGLGVFDGVVVLLTPNAPPHEVIGALLLFRVAYNLVPLAIALVILALYEALERVPAARPMADSFVEEDLTEPLLSALALVSGAALLTVSAVPLEHPWGWGMVAMGVGAVCGAGLLLLARGLGRRYRLSYWGVAALLAVGAVAMLAAGKEELALGLGLSLLPVLGAWPRFAHRPWRLPRLTPAWWAAVAALLMAALWLTLFAAKLERLPPWASLAGLGAAVLLAVAHAVWQTTAGRRRPWEAVD